MLSTHRFRNFVFTNSESRPFGLYRQQRDYSTHLESLATRSITNKLLKLLIWLGSYYIWLKRHVRLTCLHLHQCATVAHPYHAWRGRGCRRQFTDVKAAAQKLHFNILVFVMRSK